MKKLAVARLVSQILRDMPAPGSGQARASELAAHAGVQVADLAGLIGKVMAELTQLALDSEFAVTIDGDFVNVERRAARMGVFSSPQLIVAPMKSLGLSLQERKRLADKVIALLPSYYRTDAAGRRRIVEVLATRPYEEVEQVLEASLWIAKQTKGLTFWQAAMRRLKEARENSTWERRLEEAQDTFPDRYADVRMLAEVRGSAKPEDLTQASWSYGVFVERVLDEIESRRAQKTCAG